MYNYKKQRMHQDNITFYMRNIKDGIMSAKL